MKRGFEPVLNRSFHWIKNEEFKKAITNFCVEEAQILINIILELKSLFLLKMNEYKKINSHLTACSANYFRLKRYYQAIRKSDYPQEFSK
ncbi:MAG: hypothetical protein CM15mP127_10280 [Gammaproteobacteria bacterium]|nr:MAG: hypothetical protein CM15mP127_10280 [Gammaproteobacteria bacterium]